MKRRIIIFVMVVVAILICGIAVCRIMEPPRKIVKAHFSDGQGNALILYICKTERIQKETLCTQVDIDAAAAVFDVENAVLVESFFVEGFPAAIYKTEEHGYACWTTTTEVTGIMRYNLGSLTDEEVHKVVKSVYVQTDFSHAKENNTAVVTAG